MDEGSQSSSQSPSPPPQPAAARVTVAAPPQNTLTLALPIQQPRPGAGGREDCWSEGATSALIDAWGDRYLELSRGNLKQKQWQEVADAVCSRDDYTKPPKSDVQCKNRIDTLKKKYKLEKSKHATSSWPFFHRLDLLIGSKPSLPSITNHSRTTIAAAAAAAAAAAGTTKIAPFPQRRRTLLPPQPQNLKRSISESQSSDSSLPPETQNGTKRQPTASGRIRGLTELAQAIVRFGAVYERVESSKLQQALEMEKQRLGFARELELQRAHFFTKTQAELSQLKRRRRRPPSIGTSNIINNNSSLV